MLVAYEDVLHLLFFRFIEPVVHYLAVSQRLLHPFDLRYRHRFAKHIHLDFIEPGVLFEHTSGFALVLARCKDLTMEQGSPQRHYLRFKFVLAVLVQVIQQVVVALHHLVEQRLLVVAGQQGQGVHKDTYQIEMLLFVGKSLGHIGDERRHLGMIEQKLLDHARAIAIEDVLVGRVGLLVGGHIGIE